jgi:mannose-6-phosphate isomerase
MTATKLSMIRVEKLWGRRTLWPGFDNPGPDALPVGEIWFDAPNGQDLDLMVKYLFTSERLSIQVHPDDADAIAAGYPRGKDEAWIILDAEPDSTIALGTVRPVTRDAIHAAALDGSIETLMHWQSVKAGDVIYSPAGVVHAIGPGLTLVEIQQNVDLTYRLYDYGRPRELHLESGIAVSNPAPFVIANVARALTLGRTVIVEGGKFIVERWSDALQTKAKTGWFVPLSGSGQIGAAQFCAGECWYVDDETPVALDVGSIALFAYTGGAARQS